MKKITGLIFLLISAMVNAQNVGVGTTSPAFKLDVRNGSINTDSVYRIGFATVLAVPEVGNLFIGKDAGVINTGAYNTFSGNLAGSSNMTGGSNSFFGQTSGFSSTTGDNNSFFGRSAGFYNTTGSNNSFYGRSAAFANTRGDFNTAMGNSSLTNLVSGSLNTALGYNANVNTPTQTNATAIGANTRVDCNNCLVLGSVNGINGATSGVQVGIGTTSPHISAQLEVNSSAKGFLPPRMTTAQRDAITNPTPGLMLFNTDTQNLEIYTVYGWYGLQPQLQPRKLFGGNNDETVACIRQTSDGGYIMAGHTNSSANGDINGTNHGVSIGSNDVWIVKLDANRNISWSKLLGGNSEETVACIRQTGDGGYIVAANSRSSVNGDVSGTNHGSYDYWIIKLDDQGNIEWDKLIGGSSLEIAGSIRQTTDGGYIVAGYSNSSANGNVTETSHGLRDYWIVKLDASGNISWNRLLGGSSNEEAYDVVQASDGSFLIAGFSTSSANGNVTPVNHGGQDSWIVKLNAAGSIMWNQLLGGTGDELAQSIQQINTNDFIFAGHSSSSESGDVTATNHGPTMSFDYWIVKLDRFGDIVWNKLIGGNGQENAYSIQQTTDNGYIVAGASSSSASGNVTAINHGIQDNWIVKLDGAGNVIWDRLIGGNSVEIAFNIQQTTDGGFIVTGNSLSSFNGDVTAGNHGQADIWVFKLGTNGFLY